jgi:RHH-type proline utilization regulon transcriptional repressor/proline dehydrogenase/delta 1-pyrroline-5-carboxylate dehydrogenase
MVVDFPLCAGTTPEVGCACPHLIASAQTTETEAAAIAQCGHVLLQRQRYAQRAQWATRLLQEYGLDSPEGLALLELAEAYPRISDRGTAEKLLMEKLAAGRWTAHSRSRSSRVNAARSLLKIARETMTGSGMGSYWLRLAARPLVKKLLERLARQYIAGTTIETALRQTRAQRQPRPGSSGAASAALYYSFDMLGESAVTAADAERYLDRYYRAIAEISKGANSAGSAQANDGISIKLSALDPRYEPAQRRHVVARLASIVLDLARTARERNVGLTIDAEEAERLELSLEVLEAVASDEALAGWDGLGFAVQAYQRRALQVINWAEVIARQYRLTLAVRLVKGAYWDAEIKRAQESGLADYPVYTRKVVTDVSFLACARQLLECRHLYPAFATHNAQTVATIYQWYKSRTHWEFQRLYGMGAGLHEVLSERHGLRCRVYAPVGDYQELLPYLVRRTLENGANSGWVYRLLAADADESDLLVDPAAALARTPWLESEVIMKPQQLSPYRPSSAGIDFSDRRQTLALLELMQQAWATPQRAAPIVGGRELAGPAAPVYDPANSSRTVGTVVGATAAQVAEAFERAARAQPGWAAQAVEARASCLTRMADLLEARHGTFMALLVREGGKTVPDALADLREAVDFCRYYAVQAQHWMTPMALPGPKGESNELRWEPRGIFACISPWNFPLAIFLGQIAAALVCGNAVLAKPAPQTPLVAAAAVRLLLEAGIPPDVIALLPGGDEVGAAIIADRRLSGVAFTGSTITARRIARSLLEDETRPLVPLLAETGGLNAMIVDSSALPQQVVTDAVTSAFRSAGQRCSALRLLCLQEEIAQPTLSLLIGAMQELRIGDPAELSTDVGPVIDEDAQRGIEAYIEALAPAQILCRTSLPEAGSRGHFVAPTLVRLSRVEELQREVFGPVLHVVTWRAGELDALIGRINASGYGLTMGLETRLNEHIERVRRQAQVGNLYVNRSIIGAMVGTQPFGGERLSGTGPKAGGPHYLLRFMTERTVTINTAAIGGDVELARSSG